MQKSGVSLIHKVLQFSTMKGQTSVIISFFKKKTKTNQTAFCDTTTVHEKGRLANIVKENLDTSKN